MRILRCQLTTLTLTFGFGVPLDLAHAATVNRFDVVDLFLVLNILFAKLLIAFLLDVLDALLCIGAQLLFFDLEVGFQIADFFPMLRFEISLFLIVDGLHARCRVSAATDSG